MSAPSEPGSKAVGSIGSNALLNMLRVVSGIAFPIVTFPYVSRVLGPEGVGKVNFAISFTTYFALFASLGIPLYGIREIAKVRDQPAALRRLCRELLVLHACGIAFSCVAYLLCLHFVDRLESQALLFLVVGATLPLSLLTLDWFYQGLEQYAYITVRTLLFSFASLVALFLMVHDPADYVLYAGIAVAASLGSSLLNFWNARGTIFGTLDEAIDLRRHLPGLRLVFAFNVASSLYVNLDTVLLGFLSSHESVGFYTTAMKLTKIVLSVVVSVGGVLLPRLAWHLANGRREEFDRLVTKSLGFVLMLCLPAAAGLVGAADQIVAVLAGPAYAPSAGCLMVLAPTVIFIGLSNLLGLQVLYPLGRERFVVASVAIGAVVSLVANLLLIPGLHHAGAAWAALAAEGSVLAFQLVVVARICPIRPDWPSALRYCLGGSLVLAAGLALDALPHGIPGAFLLPSKVAVGALAYAGLLAALRDPLFLDTLRTMKEKIANARA